jgi:SMP-30/gluconolaconase/LRE-like protein/GAF domain-containing protein
VVWQVCLALNCNKIPRLSLGENMSSCGTAAFRKERVIVSDVATDPVRSGLQPRDVPLAHGLRATWSQPLMSKDNEVLGRLGVRQPFATLPDSGTCSLDGMTLDASGRLDIAHYGCGRIAVLRPDGQLLRRYAAGNRLADNVAFGGVGLRELYVTGAPGEKTGPGAIYRLALGTRGRSSRALPAS